jgi:hypothetical protein
MVVGCHQQPTIAVIFFDNGNHIIGNIPTDRACEILMGSSSFELYS